MGHTGSDVVTCNISCIGCLPVVQVEWRKHVVFAVEWMQLMLCVIAG